jgi:futalosine hydrolase
LRRLLVVTAVEAERAAVLAGDDTFDVVAAGVGAAAAAAGTARALAFAEASGNPYTAVISAGVAGGFPGRVEVGAVALCTRSIAADLGADSPEGFLSLDALGFGATALDADAALLAELRAALPDAAAGPILTVTTVTGTAAGAAELLERHPDAVAEAMEGFGVAVAAVQVGTPFAELRTISNLVGPRDRNVWQIGRALKTLTVAFSVTRKNG